MSEKRFTDIWCSETGHIGVTDYGIDKEFTSSEFEDFLNELNEENDVLKQQLQTRYVVNKQYEELQRLKKENEDLREVNKENQLLHEENVKQCERWKKLYEIKDAEVTARVDALNRVCEYYTSEVLFKSDVDPNKAVQEVINEILNTEVENDE